MFTYDFEIYDLYHKLSESQIERLYEMLEKDREEYKAGWFDRNGWADGAGVVLIIIAIIFAIAAVINLMKNRILGNHDDTISLVVLVLICIATAIIVCIILLSTRALVNNLTRQNRKSYSKTTYKFR